MNTIDTIYLRETAAKLEMIADKLDIAISKVEGKGLDTKVDMDMTDVRCPVKNEEYGQHYTADECECGTPGCAAGWLAIALEAEATNMEWTDGRYKVGLELGVSLGSLASISPKVWGNPWGGDVFESAEAWDVPRGVLFPPEAISKKLRDVSDRLYSLDDKLGHTRGISYERLGEEAERLL